MRKRSGIELALSTSRWGTGGRPTPRATRPVGLGDLRREGDDALEAGLDVAEVGLRAVGGAARGGRWFDVGDRWGLDLAHGTRFLSSRLDGAAALWADPYGRRNGL